MSMMLVNPFILGAPKPTLLEALTTLGLTTNLKLCLDAGDSASYALGPKWQDTSGQGADFFLGADGSATSTDPAFAGNYGARSDAEYFSFDGGDYFTYDTSNEAWMDSIHKAGAVFSAIAWIYAANPTVVQSLFGTTETSGTVGFLLNINASSQLNYLVRNSVTVRGGTSTATVSASTWQMVGVSLTEGSGATGGNLIIDNTVGTFIADYNAGGNSPSTGPASSNLKIGTNGAATVPGMFRSGSRMGMCAMWSGTKLSAAELQSIYQATRARYGV